MYMTGGVPNYRSIFGSRVAPVTVPLPQANLRSATPLYNDIQGILSQNILNNLSGTLSPAYQDAVMRTLNARAVGAGVGGSDFANNALAYGLGREVQNQQNLGLQQALNYFPVQSQTATVRPELLAEINRFNNLATSAPEPSARGQFEIDQLNQAINRANNPTPFRPLFGSGTAIPAGGGGGISAIAGGYVGQYSPNAFNRYSFSQSPSVFGYGTNQTPLTFNQNISPSVPVPPLATGNTLTTSPSGEFGPAFSYLPENFGSLTPSQQSDYVNTWLMNSGIDASQYE